MIFKKIIFQNWYVELETPPFMEKTILNIHFDYLNPSLIMYLAAKQLFSSLYIASTFVSKNSSVVLSNLYPV